MLDRARDVSASQAEAYCVLTPGLSGTHPVLLIAPDLRLCNGRSEATGMRPQIRIG